MTHEAQVTTAAVEVKTLTVKGRQVTLAVFRQIQPEQLIDKGAFVGLPWGTVNYHPKCKNEGEHLHVVWQKDKELRHAIEAKPQHRRMIETNFGEEWLDAKTMTGWVPSKFPKTPGSVWIGFRDIDSGQTPVLLWAEQEHCDIWKASISESLSPPEGSWQLDHLRRKSMDALNELKSRQTRDVETVQKDLVDDCNATLQLRSAELARWEELKALPQLFIAV